jgi:DNA-binding NarL/FixJ family response regulator
MAGENHIKRPRVLLADDHTLVAEAIGKLLEPRFELLGTAADGRSLLEQARRLRPDVILLDISMPVLNGIDAAKKLRKVLPEARILFLSMHADPLFVTDAFRAGGHGYLLKRSAASELVFAIEEILKGRYYVTPAVAADVMRPVFEEADGVRIQPPGGTQLTPRQREVLQLVAEGKSIKEIATILDISVKTVEFHKSRIMSELDLHTTADLTKFAVVHGIASLEPS